MSSPISLSGFNNIDFGSIVNALMAIERQPVAQLEKQQSAMKVQTTFLTDFASSLASLKSASEALYGAGAFDGRAATVSDPTSGAVSVSSSTPIGSYEVLVTQLARAQVSTTDSTHVDKDTTVVASAGSLVIGGVTVTLAGNTTLQGLADAINQTPNIGASASVVYNNGGYTLALTGHDTGAAKSFAITNNLTGGSGVSFGAINAQDAADAAGTVNGVAFSSSTNVVEGVLPGGTLTVYKRNPVEAFVITIRSDTDSIKALVKAFQSSYNKVVDFIDDQARASAEKNPGSIGRDPLVRGLRGQLASVLNTQQGSGTFTAISQVGLSFARSGQLEFNEAEFDKAISADAGSVERLFKGSGATLGVFNSLQKTIESYTTSQGLVPSAQARLAEQLLKIGNRIDEFERRLAVRREAMQKEFTAADMAISQLKASAGQLSSLSSSVSSF